MHIRQKDATDCGAACLASIAAWYRLRIPVTKIRQYAGTDRRGTTVAGLIEAAACMGLLAKGVKAASGSLTQIPLPAIAHMKMENGLHHYVVICKAADGVVWFMDPAYGKIRKEKTEAFVKQWTGVLLLLLPDTSFRPGNAVISVTRRLFQLVRPHTGVMIQAVAGAIVYTALGLSTSLYLRQIVDHVLVHGNIRLLNLLGVIMIALLVFQIVIGYIRNIFVLRTGQHMDAGLILGYYRHLLELPQRFFDTMRVGEILSRINDAVKIRLFVNDVAIDIIVNVCIVLFSVSLMFLYHWKLALITVLVLPLYAVIYIFSNHSNRIWQRKLMEGHAALEAQLVESLGSIGTVKRLGLEPDAFDRTEAHFVRLLRTVYKSSVRILYSGSASEFVTKLFTIVVLWSGSFFVIGRAMSPGELLSFYALLGYFTGPAVQLIAANRQIQDALIAAERLFEIIDLERESGDGRGIDLTRDTIQGGIRFAGVHFRYGTRTPVLRGLDMYIPEGASAGVVGASGCGKSTLLSLLHKLYPPQAGAITVGTHDTRYVSNASLRRVIGVVPQHTDLFAGTILENIAVGDPAPDLLKIGHITRVLGLHPFIESLPDHYYTFLEEHGGNLSGGQRQRIAIARALYRDPEVLALDESTSSLDAESEKAVQQALAWYKAQGKTIVIIAHRLTAVRDCDIIFVLQDGVVAEQGSHRELIRKGGVYAKMWSLR